MHFHRTLFFPSPLGSTLMQYHHEHVCLCRRCAPRWARSRRLSQVRIRRFHARLRPASEHTHFRPRAYYAAVRRGAASRRKCRWNVQGHARLPQHLSARAPRWRQHSGRGFRARSSAMHRPGCAAGRVAAPDPTRQQRHNTKECCRSGESSAFARH